jgi:hypothetical protein
MRNITARIERLKNLTNKTGGFVLFCASHWPYMLDRASKSHNRAMELSRAYAPKKIITVKRSTLGTSIVIRSPFSRRWIMNITLAPKRPKCDHLWVKEYDGAEYCAVCLDYKRAPLSLEWMPGYTVAKAGMALTLLSLVVLTLTGCADTAGPALDAKEKQVSTRYINEDSVSLSCWYPSSVNPQKDSLIVGKSRYTISERSRYSVETLSHEYLDVLQEGPVNQGDWAVYRDTKTDSIYIFLDCASRDELKGMR